VCNTIERVHELLTEYKKANNPYTGSILLSPADFEHLKTQCMYTIFKYPESTLYGLPVSGHTDEDIGWWAMEFTGLPKDHPEVLDFVASVEFRNKIYKEQL